MDRKSFFKRLDKVSHGTFRQYPTYSVPTSAPSPSDLSNWDLAKLNRSAAGSLAVHTGPLTEQQVAHLLKRTCYGASLTDTLALAGSSADTLVESLFQDYAQPADPLNMSAEEVQTDPTKPWFNPTGKFVDGGLYTEQLNTQRREIVSGMWNDLIIGCGLHIREKMVVFLSSYLVVQWGNVKDARLFYRYLRLLRNFASKNGTLAGNPSWNFKELIKQLTVEPAMLIYLNGDGSDKDNPNENYGRELQELFTIGKGIQKSEGEYTTYSEEDVRAAARVLTGWKVQGNEDHDQNFTTYTNPPIKAVFTPVAHDSGSKKFSGDYGGATIGPSSPTDPSAGTAEISAMVDLIFSQAATAENIVSRLYRTFVYYYIDQRTHDNIIVPLAEYFKASGYDMSLVLKRLLKSEHFFDALNVGCIIKDPVMFVTIAKHNFGITTGDVIGAAGEMLMPLGYPAEVAGWKGTYEEPFYHEWWISTITVDARTLLTNGRNGVDGGLVKGNIDAIKRIVEDPRLVSDPTNVDKLITELARHFFPSELYNDPQKPYPGPITPKQLLFLKGILIPGQPDFEWNAQIYGPYKAGDAAAKQLYESHLIDLLHYMFSMAEYYLC